MTEPTEVKCVCGRHLYKSGTALVVEAAIDPNGDSPFHTDLKAMLSSGNKAVVNRAYDIQERMRQLALYGKLEVPREMNHLSGDLWEIKTSEDRAPFYERPPQGHKRAVRLAFIFEKKTSKTKEGRTPQKHINRGLWIVKGDVAHG